MKTHLAVLAVTIAASFSAVAVSPSDIQGAQVVTVTTKAVPGYLNIGNGRNCLSENVQGKPALLECGNIMKAAPVESTFHYIVLKSGQCLSDEGEVTPGVAICDYQNPKQQWKVLQGVQTEVRNVVSNKCLTAAKLNNPVNMAVCKGFAEQSWKLPQ